MNHNSELTKCWQTVFDGEQSLIKMQLKSILKCESVFLNIVKTIFFKEY